MDPSKRIAIVGGSGFVGGHLAAVLEQRGYAVRIPTRATKPAKSSARLAKCEVVETDVHDTNQLERALVDCQAVVFLPGLLNEGRGRNETFQAVHVDLVEKVTVTAHKLGIRRLLHMSAINAAPSGPSSYLSTKAAGEQIALDSPLDTTLFRPSVIFGPGDNFFLQFAQLLRVSPGVLPLACPGARMSPVYIQDLVQAFADSLEDDSTIGQCYELTGPRDYTLRELVQYTARTAGLSRYILPLPDMVSRLMAHVMVYAPGKPFSMDNYRSLQVDAVSHGDNGLEHFRITPTPLEDIVPSYLGST